ncbi:hypothetical protein [Bacillus sp. CDB3]|uniref:hypothetical protein n=1 Tax=Bacillus sp. CDB3 TaxID=360310 RepID=UPI0015C48D64|nr:hypothetical protein [Bacillus sp. CDB3]
MIENPMLIGNHHDSSTRDFIEECAGCNGEIYFGESFLDFDGNYWFWYKNSKACAMNL